MTDDLDRHVDVIGVPKRIVALSPAVVEVLFALGITPVGRPSAADYPEEARQVYVIGTTQRPSYERIAELKPDLIIGNTAPNDERIAQLEKLDAPTLLYHVASYSDVLRVTRAIGQVVNREADAQRIVKTIEDRLAATKAKVPSQKPSVLILMGSGKSFYTALPASYVGSLARELGAANMASGPEDRLYRGFSRCSLEKLLEKDPDVVVAIRPSSTPERAPSVLPTLDDDGRWRDWKALKPRRVYEVSPKLFLQHPGLRVGDAIAEVASILYPNAFPR
ncbi:MAG: ABC transporter substrate-binding protein [Dehalococcoidia bacterium]|nr:ABC transporter substrate-binding protein [Dehalococcoidia bacterium]